MVPLNILTSILWNDWANLRRGTTPCTPPLGAGVLLVSTPILDFRWAPHGFFMVNMAKIGHFWGAYPLGCRPFFWTKSTPHKMKKLGCSWTGFPNFKKKTSLSTPGQHPMITCALKCIQFKDLGWSPQGKHPIFASQTHFRFFYQKKVGCSCGVLTKIGRHPTIPF